MKLAIREIDKEQNTNIGSVTCEKGTQQSKSSCEVGIWYGNKKK